MTGKELLLIRKANALSQKKMVELLNFSVRKYIKIEKMEEIPDDIAQNVQMKIDNGELIKVENLFQNDDFSQLLIDAKNSEIEALKKTIESKDELICCLKKMIFLNEDQKKDETIMNLVAEIEEQYGQKPEK